MGTSLPGVPMIRSTPALEQPGGADVPTGIPDSRDDRQLASRDSDAKVGRHGLPAALEPGICQLEALVCFATCLNTIPVHKMVDSSTCNDTISP